MEKEPIAPESLRRLVWLYASEQAADLKGIRIACMCLLCYAGILRYSELASLKRNNIYFCHNYVKLFLENRRLSRRTGSSHFQNELPYLPCLHVTKVLDFI